MENKLERKFLKGTYLSNFYICSISFVLFDEKIIFKSAEHLFQAMKATNLEDVKKIANCETPKEAKKIGNEIKIIQNWDLIKIEKMKEIVFQKFFQNEILKKELIKMKDEDLIEWNDWGDIFWGKNIETGEGENNLGKILVEVRNNLIKK